MPTNTETILIPYTEEVKALVKALTLLSTSSSSYKMELTEENMIKFDIKEQSNISCD